ncbi:flagellar export protein FliJ [Desulforamulus putei]|uniref:Flagellar FliJ protein n=1 Tax=Desulforamulus putei DSM 12395 TaxID=1121429 RepID=A0A1M5B3X2_9FIRM|nr:flagellar export protein FliJ [Desulforamulus putei]SHF37261.1 flagellar FliJ protein [Desulforamulus putei DSM 12395]
MKKFHFRLEQVLQQKIKQEEQALLELAKAQQECARCERELNESKGKMQQTIAYTESIRHPGEHMQSLIYLEHLQKNIQCQQRLLQRAQEIVQLRKEAALKARQERMILEKLKEKQVQEYKELEFYLEQKEIDELATSRYIRTIN